MHNTVPYYRKFYSHCYVY